MVYGLIQAHHGAIDIQSEVGKGTVVSLFFPVTRSSNKNIPVSHLSDPALRGQETILVSRTRADVGFFLETVLRSHGYRVLLAHEYEQALHLFETQPQDIDLVFSDVGCPRSTA